MFCPRGQAAGHVRSFDVIHDTRKDRKAAAGRCQVSRCEDPLTTRAYEVICGSPRWMDGGFLSANVPARDMHVVLDVWEAHNACADLGLSVRRWLRLMTGVSELSLRRAGSQQ